MSLNDDVIVKHYISSFNQKPLYSMKFGLKNIDVKIHIFYPTEEYDFYKLCTSGCTYLLNDKNEYMMFLSKDVPVNKGSVDDEFIFYPLFLLKASLIGLDSKVDMSFYDVSDLEQGDAKGVMYLPSQIIKDASVMKLDYEGKKYKFLQVMPLTEKQYQKAINSKLTDFAEMFYTHDDKFNLVKMKPFADDFIKRDVVVENDNAV